MKERKIMPFDKNFVPALRFAVMSDIHIDDEDCIEEQRFAKALDDLKNLCSSDERYSGFDALVIVGDFASRGSEIQMCKVKKILDAGLPADVRLIMTMASHEYMTDGEENALRRFDAGDGLFRVLAPGAGILDQPAKVAGHGKLRPHIFRQVYPCFFPVFHGA